MIGSKIELTFDVDDFLTSRCWPSRDVTWAQPLPQGSLYRTLLRGSEASRPPDEGRSFPDLFGPFHRDLCLQGSPAFPWRRDFPTLSGLLCFDVFDVSWKILISRQQQNSKIFIRKVKKNLISQPLALKWQKQGMISLWNEFVNTLKK